MKTGESLSLKNWNCLEP